MKNTFSPIELQVISNLLNTGSVEYVEADILREKIERLKAQPVSLRETAKQYVADLINGVIQDPNPQRLEAAKTVLEYSAFDDEQQEPAEPQIYRMLAVNGQQIKEGDKITLDSEGVHVTPIDGPPFNIERTVWDGDDIPPSARIKDLDCSTPEPYIRDGVTYKDRIESEIAFAEESEPTATSTGMTDPTFLKDSIYPMAGGKLKPNPNAVADFGPDVHGKYRVGGGPVRNYVSVAETLPTGWPIPDPPEFIKDGLDFAKIAAEGGPVVPGDWKQAPTLESGTGGPTVEPPFPINCLRCGQFSEWMHKHVCGPMSLERAVAVLDGNQYRGCFWIIDMAGTEDPPNRWALGTFTRPSTGQLTLTEFEAISVAEKLEREK